MALTWTPALIAPPMNGQVVSPYLPETFDLRWDDPAILAANAGHTVVGVNIYRATDSDRGPYHRITLHPVGGGFYRDQTSTVPVQEAIPYSREGWASLGPVWTLKTSFPPANAKGEPTTDTQDVQVFLDGARVPLAQVSGPRQEVTLGLAPLIDPISQRWVLNAVTPETLVEVHYARATASLKTELQRRIFYRLTTVVLESGEYRESELSDSPPLWIGQVETLDYIWREAIRRNNWILEQGGEPVKLFIRKTSGTPCYCGRDPQSQAYDGQAHARCLRCFGTGFVGGYEGPFDINIAPDDVERRISQGMWGRRVEHSYEVWIGPTPVISQRDFIVKQTNERYSVGPVKRSAHRGAPLQQHFTIGLLDEQDARYRVPVSGVTLDALLDPRPAYRPTPPPTPNDGTPEIVAERDLPTAPLYPVGPSAQSPTVTDKASVPAEAQPRGRTPAWERTQW